jgi:hypothetical protein
MTLSRKNKFAIVSERIDNIGIPSTVIFSVSIFRTTTHRIVMFTVFSVVVILPRRAWSTEYRRIWEWSVRFTLVHML